MATKIVKRSTGDYDFNPAKNDKVIVLEQQPDGNWVAIGQRHGKIVRVREGMPESALGRLLVHP